jgi:hypothetical protein
MTKDALDNISTSGGLAEIIAGMNANGGNAGLDAPYLVTTMAMPTSGGAGSASQAPAPAPASKLLLDTSGYSDWTGQPIQVTGGPTLKTLA